jgi:adenine-specific DNA-methyltransferase
MRFIGNKELINSDIKKLFYDLELVNNRLTFFDAFCGTGAVSDSLKGYFNIISNDISI